MLLKPLIAVAGAGALLCACADDPHTTNTAIGGAGLSRASTAAEPWLAANAAPGKPETQPSGPSNSSTRARGLDSKTEPVAKPGHLKAATGSISASQPMRNATLDPVNAVLVRDANGFTGVAGKPENSVTVAHPAAGEATEHAVQNPFAALDAERKTRGARGPLPRGGGPGGPG